MSVYAHTWSGVSHLVVGEQVICGARLDNLTLVSRKRYHVSCQNCLRAMSNLPEHPMELREIGLTYQEIADVLDISKTHVYRLCNPDYNARHLQQKREWHQMRAETLRGTCADCGAETRYNPMYGPDTNYCSMYCVPCSRKHPTLVAA